MRGSRFDGAASRPTTHDHTAAVRLQQDIAAWASDAEAERDALLLDAPALGLCRAETSRRASLLRQFGRGRLN